MNSFPRIACTTGEFNLEASAISSGCAPAHPAPPRIVIFFDGSRTLASVSSSSSEGHTLDSETGNAGAARPLLQSAERYLQESPLPQRRAETPRSALPIPGREAFVRDATPIRNNGCIVRKDARDEFLENNCCPFQRWGSARQWRGPERGCDDNRRDH